MAQLQEEEGTYSHKQMRDYLCFSLLQTSDLHNRLADSSVDGVRNYTDRMSKVDVPGDHVMLLTAATTFKRRIHVIPVFKEKYQVINYNPVGGIIPQSGDLHLLKFSKAHFTNEFYMSIIKDPHKRNSLPTGDSPLESTGHNFTSNASRISFGNEDSLSGIFDHSTSLNKNIDKDKDITPSPPPISKLKALKAKKQADYDF